MIDMSNILGYKDYQRALKIVSGEEVSPTKETEIKDETQIDSRQVNTLDMIDPLFAMALNGPSI